MPWQSPLASHCVKPQDAAGHNLLCLLLHDLFVHSAATKALDDGMTACLTAHTLRGSVVSGSVISGSASGRGALAVSVVRWSAAQA